MADPERFSALLIINVWLAAAQAALPVAAAATLSFWHHRNCHQSAPLVRIPHQLTLLVVQGTPPG
jgi:hypothetical protein